MRAARPQSPAVRGFFALSKAEREFRVIGVLHGMQTETAYCPFEYLRLESVAEEETNYAESASFILGDNRGSMSSGKPRRIS